MQKIWLGVILILISLGVYSLYGYLRLESPPIEEESILKPAPPAYGIYSPGVSPNEIVIGSSLALGGHASFLGTQYLHGAMCLIK
ncbi:MAG: hypothetical protein KAU38_06935, partial [Desulfobacterales bacterium]|nr:hypothetical protein [Desulfobacterales bacterium]